MRGKQSGPAPGDTKKMSLYFLKVHDMQVEFMIVRVRKETIHMFFSATRISNRYEILPRRGGNHWRSRRGMSIKLDCRRSSAPPSREGRASAPCCQFAWEEKNPDAHCCTGIRRR